MWHLMLRKPASFLLPSSWPWSCSCPLLGLGMLAPPACSSLCLITLFLKETFQGKVPSLSQLGGPRALLAFPRGSQGCRL